MFIVPRYHIRMLTFKIQWLLIFCKITTTVNSENGGDPLNFWISRVRVRAYTLRRVGIESNRCEHKLDYKMETVPMIRSSSTETGSNDVVVRLGGGGGSRGNNSTTVTTTTTSVVTASDRRRDWKKRLSLRDSRRKDTVSTQFSTSKF